MSDGLKIQGEVSLSSEGAEASLQRVERAGEKMATGLQTSAQKAGAAVDSIGDGADKSADQFTRAESRMAASIKRATTQLEQLGKTASQKLEFQISERGLDASKFEPQLRKLRELETTQLALGTSAKKLPTAYDDIARSLGGLAVAGTGLVAVIGGINKLVDTQREFDKINASLVTMTGSAANAKIAFGAIQDFAATTPFSLQEVATAFTRLKSLGLEPSEKALISYGNTASAMGKSLEQFIEAVADASTGEFERLKEFGIKAKKEGDSVSLTFQGITTTIGNSATEIEQYLQKIGNNEFAGAMSERAKTLDGAISNLSDSWDNLFLTINQNNTGGLIFDSVKLASGAVTDLTGMFKALSASEEEVSRETGALTALQNGLGRTFETLAVIGTNVAYVLKQAGNEIGGIAAQAAAFASLDFKGAFAIGKLMKEDAEAARAELDRTELRIMKVRTAANAANSGFKALFEGLEDFGKSAEEKPKSIDKVSSSVNKLGESIRNMRIDELQRMAKEAQKELDGLTKAEAEYYKALSDGSSGLEDKARQLELEVEYYGKAESAIQAVLIARLEEARALASANGAYPEHLAYLDREIEARKRIASASAQKEYLESTTAAAKSAAREWEKFSDDINRSLTDSLYRAFESGESFGESFAKSLQNTFKTMALKLAVNYVVNGAGQLVGTAGNSVINAALGTSGSNAGAGVNWLGMANNAQSAYSLGSYGTAAMAAYAQYSAGIPVTSWSLGTYAPVVNAVSSTGAVAGGGTSATAGGGASTGSGAMATVGWVAAIVAGMWMSSEAYKAGIRWENYAKEKGSEYDLEVYMRESKDKPMRALFGDSFVESEFYAVMSGSSLSAQIHGALKKALWGGEWEASGQPKIKGTFSEADEFTNGKIGQKYKRDGGWFSSGDETTKWQRVSAEFDSVMDGMYRTIRNTFIMTGDIFGDDTLSAKLAGFSFTFQEKKAEDMGAAVSRVAESLTEAMGNILFPSIQALRNSGEAWSAAFGRVLQEASAVNRVFDLMGKTMTGVFGEDNANGILYASDAFVKLFGSIDAFNASFSAYYSNFYTQAEQVGQAWDDMEKNFSMLGVAMPTTRAEFRALVDSLDLSTESGRGTFAALMSLQGAFAQLTPTLEDVAAAAMAVKEAQAAQIGRYLEAQRAAQADLIKDQISAAQLAAESATVIASTFKGIVDSLGEYQRTLLTGQGAGLSPEAQYAEARRAYDATASKARLGDSAAALDLPAMADAFLAASLAIGSAESYARDLGGVAGTVDAVIGVAQRQVPIAESQLQVAQAQLATLNELLAKASGDQSPIVVSDFAQAAKDWTSFFSSTAVGDVVNTAAGTMQRISESMGMFIDKAGTGYTFSSGETPYALAGASSAFREWMLEKYGAWTVPSFASGGYHAGGLRLVGENGPELEVTGPASIINAADTMAIAGSGSQLIAELQALRAEVATLREEQRAGHSAIAGNTSRSARTLEKFDIDGMPEVRAA